MTQLHVGSITRSRNRMWLFGAVLVGTALIGTWSHASPRLSPILASMGISSVAELPIVRAAVNEHFRQIVQQSTYTFDFSAVVDDAPKLIQTPVFFEYAGAGGSAFTLGPSGFVSLAQSGGYVYDVTVALPRRSEPLRDIYRTAIAVDSALTATRWRRTGGALPTLDQIQHDWRSPDAGDGESHDLGEWRLGTAELIITLKRSAKRGEPLSALGERAADDRYFVEVEVYDGARLPAYEARLSAIRRRPEPSDPRLSLPLSSVLDDVTAVPTVAADHGRPRD